MAILGRLPRSATQRADDEKWREHATVEGIESSLGKSRPKDHFQQIPLETRQKIAITANILFTAKWRSLRGLQVGFQHRRAELPWSPGKSFWREIQMVGFSTNKGQTALVSGKKFLRKIQMVVLDIMGMMDMGCISRNLMPLKDFAVHG